MSLIDLKTDLKSIKYGHDRPGGGNSGQPYITNNINNPIVSVASSFDDGFVRGGAIGAVKASVIDTLRIGKFLIDLPKGPLFIAKQVGLQLSNPKLEVKKGLGGLVSSTLTGDLGPVTGGLLQPTRLYNLGINTLAQIPANAFGIHFNRHGLLPVQDDSTKYLAVARANNEGNGKNNRLVNYVADLLPRKNPENSRILGAISNLVSIIPGASLFIKPQQQVIDRYLGGPGSVYGIGLTTIRRYDYTSNGINKQPQQNYSDKGGNPGNVNYVGLLGLSNEYFQFETKVTPGNNATTSAALMFGSANASRAMAIRGITEIPPTTVTSDEQFADQVGIDKNNLFKKPAQIDNTVVEYKSNTTAQKYAELQRQIIKQSSISQPIDNGTISGSYFSTNTFIINKASGSHYLNGNNTMPTVFDRKDYELMTVVFEGIDSRYFAGQPERWAFSAYMKGFRDNFAGTWNDINYIGRSETFYLYSKFKREVTFNLDIPCFNRTQLLSKHRALGQLASTTAGSYIRNVMGGVYLRVNVGNYLKNEYAILTNLSYEIPDDSSWDIDEKLAMYIKASISLTIIPNKRPEYIRTSPENTETGFFGYLNRPVKGFLVQESVIDKFLPPDTQIDNGTLQ
jgi:hypothetical protein